MAEPSDFTIEGRIVKLETNVAVHSAQIENITNGFDRLTDSLDGLTETMTTFTQGCVAEQSKTSTELKWLERGALFILACILTTGIERLI